MYVCVFCQPTELGSLPQLAFLCLRYCSVLSTGLGKCSHGLLLSVHYDASFCPAALHFPHCITLWAAYMSFLFSRSPVSFSLSTHALYLMQKCQNHPPSSSCHIFQTLLLYPSCFPHAWQGLHESIRCSTRHVFRFRGLQSMVL